MKNSNHSNYILRKKFSEKEDGTLIPDLISLQKESYKKFLEKDDPEKQANSGLTKAFKSFFPLSDLNKTVTLDFVSYRFGNAKYSYKECLQSGRTYSAPLYATLRLIIWDDAEPGKKNIKIIKEQEVFLCDMPLMTDNGSFIFSGIERVIISQMRRAPGVFFDLEDSKISNTKIYTARVIPMNGSWLDFEFDIRDNLYFRIDRKRKMPITTLLRAMGMSLEDILKAFYRQYSISFDGKNYVSEFDYSKVLGKKFEFDILNADNGEIVISRDTKLTKRFLEKLKNANFTKFILTESFVHTFVVAEDIINTKTGEVILPVGTRLSMEKLDILKNFDVKILIAVNPDTSDIGNYIYETSLIDKNSSQELALYDIYKSIRIGDNPTSLEQAEKMFNNLLFSSKYDLSDVGRMKINYRLGLNIDEKILHLTKEDIISTIYTLSKMKYDEGQPDDIDNLANRRLRCVGELVENQFRIGMARIERAMLEKMNSVDPNTIMPQSLINAKPLMASINDFFATSQLSQFMDQTNPLSELSHKRRISSLGPGGLTRERAGFEVRDIHYTHYGKICPVESPEGSNIGLINSLSVFARTNKYGFIETPYREVKDGILTDNVVYLSAIEEAGKTFCPYNVKLDKKNKILNETVICRKDNEIVNVTPDMIDYIDVSPRQIISVATSLVPFLENNESRRVSMGANMLKQAVPLLKSEAPYVGTGMERVIATFSNCGVVISEVEGIVKYVDASKIVIEELRGKDHVSKMHTYVLDKYLRTNNDTVINQYPVVKVGQKVVPNEIIADNQNIENGELALGKNVLVAFATWDGYNYEDSILISEKLVMEDAFTSVHLEEFEIEAKDTRLGPEEITRDIPNVSDELLKKLDETGVVYIGAHVKAGDILVGKTTPKTGAPQTPEEKLLKVIFGEKAMDVKDSSLYVPPSVVSGTVIDVKIYTRNGLDKDERAKFIDNAVIEKLSMNKDLEIALLRKSFIDQLKYLVLNKPIEKNIDKIKKGTLVTDELLEQLPNLSLAKIVIADEEINKKIEVLGKEFKDSINKLEKEFSEGATKVKECDELTQGTLKKVKIVVAAKQKIQAGDKMAGRYGNKGVISRIIPVEDMPCMADTPVVF